MHSKDDKGNNVEIDNVVQDDSILREAQADDTDCHCVDDLLAKGDDCLLY